MSHLDFASEGGVWAPEMVPGANHFYRWEISQAKILNGDTGGSWAPTSPIVLGGAGGQFQTPGLMVGGMRTQTGGRLILGQHDIIALSPGRTRKITMSLLPVTPYSLVTPNNLAQFPSPSGKQFTFFPDTYFLKAIPTPLASGLFLQNVGQPIAIPIPKAYLHTRGHAAPFDGQLASVTLNYRVLQRPGGFQSVGSAPFLSVYSQLGPADVSGVPPTAVTQLRAAGKFSSSALWDPNSPYSVGQYIVPFGFFTPPAIAAFYFKVVASTGPGLSGPTSPTWNTTPGSLTIDGNLTWQCIGGNGSLVGPTPDSFYASGSPQSFTLNLDTSIAQGLDTSANYFMVGINPPQDTTLPAPFNTIQIVYHSIQFLFTNIVSLTGWN